MRGAYLDLFRNSDATDSGADSILDGANFIFSWILGEFFISHSVIDVRSLALKENKTIRLNRMYSNNNKKEK